VSAGQAERHPRCRQAAEAASLSRRLICS
jgi:hypothetical protein